jgi:hypothetical protein
VAGAAARAPGGRGESARRRRLTVAAGRRQGGKTRRRDGIPQRRRRSGGPLVLRGSPVAPREEDNGEERLKSHGVRVEAALNGEKEGSGEN